MAELIYYYPYRVKCPITCDWKEKVEFPPKSGKFIVHSGQDSSNNPLHAINDVSNFAMLDGIVRQVQKWGTNGSLGWGVQVYYPQIDVTELTLHIKEVTVKVGQKVKAGQTTGYVGVGEGQTIAEHTHKQYESGDTLSTGLMGPKTQNPYNYTKQMKLKSEINNPVTECAERVKVLEAEVAKLNAQIVVLNAEKTAMGVVITSQAKKLADIKAIVA